MTIRQEPPSDRLHMRVDLGAEAALDGIRCQLADLSVSGLGLSGLPAEAAPQLPAVVALEVPCQGFQLKLSLPVALVWHKADKGRAGFRFLDLSRSQAETLRFIVDGSLAGKLVAVDGVLHTAGAPANRKASPVPVAHSFSAAARLKRRVSFAATFAAGALLVMLGGTLVYDRMTILETKLAAVSAPTLDIKAPTDGGLDGAVLKVGQNLAKGDVVFELVDNVLKGDIEIAAAELERDKTRLDLLARQGGLTGSASKEAKVNAESALKLAKSRQEHADAGVALADARLARSRDMVAKGLIAKDALEADQKAASEARYEAAQATREAEDASSRLRLLAKGFDAALARIENMTPGRLDESVALARADVGVREARLRALNLRREDLIVHSPCDCVVEAFYSTTGEHAKKGDLIAQLRAREAQELTVEALVNQDDADRIAIGSLSEITLPVGRALVTGKVVEINRVPKHEKRVGLPDRTPDLHGYAAVTIAPDKDLKGVELGMPVEVRLRSNTLKRLVQSVAGVFRRQESSAYAGED